VVFHLVVSFSRSAIRIDQHSVSLIPQSCLGGNAEDFKVLWLQQWCFHFSVSCKNVGIMVHHLRQVTAKAFTLHFTLWRHGGPDWFRELSKWEALEAAEWKEVKPQKSYAAVVKEHQPSITRHSTQKYGSSILGQGIFRHLVYLANYLSTNFASEFSDMVHQKDLPDALGRGP
jgi:hypothetical protein